MLSVIRCDSHVQPPRSIELKVEPYNLFSFHYTYIVYIYMSHTCIYSRYIYIHVATHTCIVVFMLYTFYTLYFIHYTCTQYKNIFVSRSKN
jgi:hypothetical protein